MECVDSQRDMSVYHYVFTALLIFMFITVRTNYKQIN
jgi:hypothetical protein